MRISSVGLSRSIFNRQHLRPPLRRRLDRKELLQAVVAETLEPRLLLSTSLFTDSFANGSISNPPYATTTANGATIAETTALTATIAHPSPAATDAAYISRSDGVAAQGLPSGTGAGIVFTNLFTLDFTSFVVTPISGVSPKNSEWIIPFRLDPSVGNNAVASMGIAYNDFLSNIAYNVSEGVEYGGGNQASVNISTSTFQAHPKQQVEIDTTITNNGSLSWTISNVLTVTDAITHASIATISKSTTATAGDSSFNPILHNNTVRYGDYSHLRGDTNYEFSGSFAETSASDAVATTAPAAPTGLGVTGGTNQEALIWTGSTGAASYNIYRSTTSGTETLLTTGISTTSYTDTTAAGGTTYYYEVTAVGSGGGESGKSNEASAITIPAAPTDLATTNGTTTEALAWTAPTGAASYIIYRSLTSGGEVQVGTSTTASYNDSGLSSGTHYYYVVAAVDASGTGVKSSELVALTLPAAPTGLNAVGGNLSIQLTWTATTGATSYNIYRSLTAGGESGVTGTSTTPSYNDTGLSLGTTYYYKVAAVDASGTGAKSTEVSGMPVATPATPTNFTATQTAGLGIPLTWIIPTGDNQTGFQIDRADDANFTVNVVTYTISSASATSYTDTTVLANSEYYYRIRATNGAGSSPNSATAGVVARGVIPLGGNIELNYDTFANIMNGAGQMAATSGNFALDTNGNPLEDFVYTSYENFEPGVWNITFQDVAANTAGVPPVIAATLFSVRNTNDTGGVTISQLPVFHTGTYDGNNNGYYSVQMTVTEYADGQSPNFGNLTFTKTLGNLTNLSIVHPGYNALTPPLFTNSFLSYIENLSPQSLRYMDASHTNGSVVQNWSDRTLPNFVLPNYHTISATLPYNTPSNMVAFNNVWTGYAWEWLIQLSNLTHTDMWINIPVEATASYVTNLANLLKYGSDINGNVYTSAQLNPYWAPLDPNLKVYVEYGNEDWNTGFIQFGLNLAQALTEQTTNQDNIDWDGSASSQYTWAARRLDEQTALISQEFAAVWGQSAINTIIRPVNAYQPGQIATLEDQLSYLANESPFGHNVNTYIYGQAVAQYLTLAPVNDDNPNLTGAQVNTDLEANFNESLNPVPSNSTAGTDLQNFTEANFYGLHPLAYEGGPALGGSPLATVNSNHLAGNAAAQRNPNFAQTTEDALNTWFTNGGGLLEYYSFGYGQFGSKYGDWPITESISDQNSPKEVGYIATRQQTALPAATAAEGYFASFPGELDARDYLGNKLAVGSNAPAEWTGTSIPNSAGPRNYVIDSLTAQTVQLKISAYTSVSGGTTLPIYLNGAPIYTSGTSWLTIAYSSAGVFSDSATVTLNLQAGLNVIRLVYASASGITTNSLKFSNSAGTFVSNTLPNIGTISSGVSVLEGVNHSSSFTVSDVETPLSGLTVTISSTNPTLYPTSNISVSSSVAGTWNYSATPVAGLSGTADIVFTITDGGGLVRSDALPFTVTPNAPTTLTASAGTAPQSQVNLTWTNTSTAYTQTKIDVSNNSSFSNTSPNTSVTYFAAKGATSFTVGALTPGTLYYFRVSAYDNAPNDEEASAYSSVVTFTTTTSSNTAPTVTTAAAASNTVTIVGLPYIVGTMANLSVAFSETGTITWVLLGTPQAAVSFSNNNSSSASTTTVTFAKAGSGSYAYKFGVYLTDANGLSVMSTLTLSVQQTAVSFTLSPTTYSVTDYGSVQLAPTSFIDQFGNPMAVLIDRNNNEFSAPPQVQYTLQSSPLGNINVSTNSYNTNNGFGLYNAPATGTGTDTATLTASFLPVTGTTTNGSTTITLTGSTNTNGFLVGDHVLGAGIPVNDTIASILSSTSFTLTAAATVSATNVSVLVGQAFATATITVTSGGHAIIPNFLAFTGNTTNASTTVSVANTTGLAIGQLVVGAGIPSDNKIVAITPNVSITLSIAATATATNVSLQAGLPRSFNGLTMSSSDPAGSPAENLIRDGNLNNYYHAAAGTGVWVGFDLGAPRTITEVDVAPRSGYTSSMVGATIQVSNDPNFTGAVTVYTFTSAPPAGQLTAIPLALSSTYRYIRILAADGTPLDLSELVVQGY